jgi:hypothetical protein
MIVNLSEWRWKLADKRKEITYRESINLRMSI